MKKFKADIDFNKENGVSYVALYTDMGLCEGCAATHPDDAVYQSEFFGCRMAETRAQIKYCKRRAHKAWEEARVLRKFLNHMSGTRTFNENAYYVSQLKKEIQHQENQRELWLARAKGLARMITEDIIVRDATVNKKEDK